MPRGGVSRTPVAYVPVAYPIALCDVMHARGEGVSTGLMDLPAPAHLRAAPPGSPLPFVVLLICIGVGGLAAFGVLVGRRAPPRRRA